MTSSDDGIGSQLLARGITLPAPTAPDTYLHVAAREGNVPAIAFLTDVLKLFIDKRGVKNATSLHVATQAGQIEAMRALLERGALVDPVDDLPWTPLMYAARNGPEEALSVLLEYRADMTYRDDMGFHPLYVAAMVGFVEGVDILITAGAPVNQTSNAGVTPFATAILDASSRTPELVVLFQKAEAQIRLNPTDGSLWHVAAKLGKNDLAEWLATQNFPCNERDALNRMPIHWAAMNGHFALLDKILSTQQAELNALDSEGFSPLHLAAMGNHYQIVATLLSAGADAEKTDHEMRLPAQLATEESVIGLFSAFTSLGGYIPVALKQQEATLSMFNEWLSNLPDSILERSLAKIAVYFFNHEKTEFALSTFSRVSILPENEMMDSVIEQVPADITNEIFENIPESQWNKKHKGMSLVHLAAKYGKARVLEALFNLACFSEKTSWDYHSSEIHSPMCLAVYAGDLASVNLLIEKEAEYASVEPPQCLSPAQMALVGNHPDIVNRFFELGVVTSCRDLLVEGSCPVYFAAKKGYVQMLRVLAKHHVPTTEIDEKTGKLPLHAAVLSNHVDAASFLLELEPSATQTLYYQETILLPASEDMAEKIILKAKGDIASVAHQDVSVQQSGNFSMRALPVTYFLTMYGYEEMLMLLLGKDTDRFLNPEDIPELIKIAIEKKQYSVVDFWVEQTEQHNKLYALAKAGYLLFVLLDAPDSDTLTSKSAQLLQRLLRPYWHSETQTTADRNNVNNRLLYLQKVVQGERLDIDSINGEGETPLYCAVKQRKFNLARLFVLGGANVEVTIHDGTSPILLAQSQQYLDLLAQMQRSQAQYARERKQLFKAVLEGLENLSQTPPSEITFTARSMTDGHCQKLAVALGNNSSVVKIDLRQNRITKTGVTYLAKGLRNHAACKILDLRENLLGTLAVRRFLLILGGGNKVIEQILLDSKKVPPAKEEVLDELNRLLENNQRAGGTLDLEANQSQQPVFSRWKSELLFMAEKAEGRWNLLRRSAFFLEIIDKVTDVLFMNQLYQKEENTLFMAGLVLLACSYFIGWWGIYNAIGRPSSTNWGKWLGFSLFASPELMLVLQRSDHVHKNFGFIKTMNFIVEDLGQFIISLVYIFTVGSDAISLLKLVSAFIISSILYIKLVYYDIVWEWSDFLEMFLGALRGFISYFLFPLFLVFIENVNKVIGIFFILHLVEGGKRDMLIAYAFFFSLGHALSALLVWPGYQDQQVALFYREGAGILNPLAMLATAPSLLLIGRQKEMSEKEKAYFLLKIFCAFTMEVLPSIVITSILINAGGAPLITKLKLADTLLHVLYLFLFDSLGWTMDGID